MTTLKLKGWKPGLQTVSLVLLIKEESTGSLITAKRLVDEFLDGAVVDVAFDTAARAEAFRKRAEKLGVIIA